MSPANRMNPRRRSGAVPRDRSCPEAVTNVTSVQEDSRADVADLADAVANLTRQLNNLQSMVMGAKSSCEAPTSLHCPPEDRMRSSDPEEDVTKPNRDRSIQDTWWFEDTSNEAERQRVAPFVPSSWVQQMSTATQMEVFDGDPRKWPTFIAKFRSLVHEVVPSDAQRLALLGQSLSPQLRSGFSGLLANPLMYRELLRRLHSLYGDPRTLAKTNLNDLLALTPLRSEQNCDLETFFCRVSGPVSTMKLCGLVHDLKSVALLEHTASKLTPRLHERWLSYERGLSFTPTLETFVDWLQTVLSERMLTSWTSLGTGTPMIRERRKPTVRTTAVSEPPTTECCICQNGRHRVAACPQFSDMSVQSRIEEVFRNGLCLRCLRKGHRQSDCSKAQRCAEQGCKAYHHRLLHGSPRLFGVANRKRKPDNPSRANTDQVNVGLAASHRTDTAIVCAVVPVIVHGNGRSVRSFALLDSGSEVSLLSERLARQANLNGPSHRLRFRTVTGESSLAARRTACEISSLDGKARFPMRQMLVIPKLHLGTRVMRVSQIKGQWEHLKDLSFPAPALERVEMLIGMDVPLAHQNFEVKVSPDDQAAPVGILTPFGWTVVGRIPNWCSTFGRQEQKWVRRHVTRGISDTEELMKLFVDADPLASQTVPGRLTTDERVALDILESTTQFDGERYTIGLLWKSMSVELPCNREFALKRFFANERRMMKDTHTSRKYEETIRQYLRDGHAKKVAEGDRGTTGRVWYLPHHAVWNSKRTKLRVVFDASAKYQGMSLNQCLLKGPDYLPNLCGVLLRFRLRRIPVSADVERMYHQVRVKREDRSALRFLWRSPGSVCLPETYEMQVHVFGAASSPCVCMYALRRAALDNRDEYPEAVERMSNVYVDNWLESFDTVEAAATACQEMNSLLKKCGFHLRQWATTMPQLLRDIQPRDLSTAMVCMPLAGSAVESALGLMWDCRTDTINFSVKALLPLEPTKREMLSCVARLYDPLGLLSPVTIIARVLMQDLWRTRCDWDEIPAEPLLRRWRQYVENLRQVENVSFPRCLCPQVADVSAHIFCDASESAYGAVAYLRSTATNQQIDTRLAFAKVRVAPVRRLSIPRLELLGAVIAVRVARLLIRELKIPKEKIWFWTDSNVVLWWLTSLNKRFPAFVENRTTEILDGFQSTQWHHVPGSENPADDLTRGLKTTTLYDEHRWLVGPQFLNRPEGEWPVAPAHPVDAAQSEEVCFTFRTTLEKASDRIVAAIERMSNLDKLLGTVVYLYRFIRNCRRADSKEGTEISEHQWAWYACIRAVQGQSFPDELRQLRLGKDLSRRSRFRRLSPFIDTRGLIRVGGRLDEAVMAYDAKHPPILPSRHHLTNLLIRKVHSQNCHAGIEATLSLVRAHAWIVDGRAAVRRVVGQCTVCRRYESNPSLPKMAPLPPSRLVRPPAPFARVGMDFMGPIMVTCRRSQVKRWICLFTCMAIRAVHLEICYSLDVSSFLSAFRRFVARRGPPSDCYSDNGTNFRAAARVLSPEAPHWDSVEISNFMTSRGIKWHFNPPSAPHFGGAWERLIRSAKIALRETLHGQRITDEALQTIVVEIEFMLNCRPLTHVSIDPSDPEPLTPNHFLQGRPFSHVPTDIVQQDNKISRRSWLFVQATLDRYWKRWMKEYVPTLAPGLNKGSDHANIAVDSVVLVVDPQAPRGRWLMGRVTRVFPGKDGTTRVAEVKTINGLMRRPLVMLLALPVVSQQETGGGMLTP